MARKLGEVLIAEGRIEEAVLSRALELQGERARGMRLGAILMRWGLVPEAGLLESLSMFHRCPAVNWTILSSAGREAVNLLTAAQSVRLKAVPYAVDRKTVRIAFSDPSNLAAIDEAQAITGRRVIPAVTTEVRLFQAQQRFYGRPLPREILTVLQKMERPKEAPAESTPAERSEAQPLAVTIEEESRPLPIEAGELEDLSIEDLIEPARLADLDGLASDELENAWGTPEALTYLPAEWIEPLNLLADETPLADFIERALTFYQSHPIVRVRETETDGPEIPERRRQESSANDSTQPSERRRSTDTPEVTL